MIKEYLAEAEERMNKSAEALKREFATLRAGRATPALLDKIQVDYYGAMTPLNQMANISAPESRMLMIQPWDKSAMKGIEKAILASDLGLTPTNDGTVIRIAIPQLTEERRKELVKIVKKKSEEAKVAVRNIRRDLNDEIKKLEKAHEVSEDDAKNGLDDAQKLTEKAIKKLDEITVAKEAEIMEV
ncbi:MAG: ribosome recycling factor [Bacillota bacterium]|nr:ribosome recycling factor [Bacillota bacterium]